MAADHREACDVVIIGGGIAGLWILDRLYAAGYHALLLERSALGDGQSIAAQGIIHSGMKYHVSRDLTLDALAEMPTLWRRALRGEGGPDLRAASVLSPSMHMWAPSRLGADMLQSAARRASRSRTEAIPAAHWPDLFRGPRRGGALSTIDEPVLDVPSVLNALRALHLDRIRRLPETMPKFHDGILTCGPVRLRPRCLIVSAGAGNEILPSELGAGAVPCQRRPLRQIVVAGMRQPVYSHCLGVSAKPLATVTSHCDGDGGWYWYVGGGLAEDGAAADCKSVIGKARRRLADWFPGADFSSSRWATYLIDRAEFGGEAGERPGDVKVVQRDRVIAAWPTKLALAPRLGAMVLERVAAAIGAGATRRDPSSAFLELPVPAVAEPPWRRIGQWH